MYQLLKKKSCNWDNIGRELGVNFAFREQLQKEGSLTTPESKLEAVIAKWIESKCSEVSWNRIITMLKELEFNDSVEDVNKYLSTCTIVSKDRKI